MSAVRLAAVAGAFYAGDARALRAQVEECLAATPARAGDATRAPKLIVVPHAGYVYSGVVAAPAYRELRSWRTRITRVVLLGPAHRWALQGLAVPRVGAFETPLGRIELDTVAIAALADLAQVSRDDRPHDFEHSLEVQLPFLQMTLGSFSLVPVLVGAATASEVEQVVQRLWGGDETLVVVSSDLSHYLPYAEARRRDRRTVERIVDFDDTLDPQEACGASALNGALRAARGHALQPHLLDLRNSGDTAGDRSRVVGYASIRFDAPAP